MKPKLINCILIILSIGLIECSIGQQNKPEFDALSAPIKNQKKSKVMILGTFHFNDGGYDAYQPKFSVDISSDKRQQEVSELVQILVKFKPTKVAIESMPEWQAFHDSLYSEFLNNRYQLGTNEIFQVSYRLAKMMNHPKLYTIDAPSREYKIEIDEDSLVQANHQEKYADTIYSKLFFALYAKEDSLKSILPLKTMLAYTNNTERLSLGLGHYLIGNIKVGADGYYPGADGATAWWNRNLRIFSNILQLASESDDERIFVLVGAGHLQILRVLAMSCPEIEFVDAYDYLK